MTRALVKKLANWTAPVLLNRYTANRKLGGPVDSELLVRALALLGAFLGSVLRAVFIGLRSRLEFSNDSDDDVSTGICRNFCF